jgi:hypothetical protein
MSAFILFFASITVLAFGIIAAYAFIIGILHTLAPRRNTTPAVTPMLVPSQTHASGD